MNLHETELSLSPDYIDQMTGEFGADITRTIAEDWQHAPLPHHGDDEKLLYVRVDNHATADEPPVLYVPGFTEGIVAKAPLAAEMATRGFDFILPGQHRKRILRGALGKKDATYSQALNYLAVLEAENLTDSPVDVITHSYGSLIFQAMQRIAKERNWSCFEGSKLIELAPAGTNSRENLIRLAGRFAWSMVSESMTKKDFKDPGGEMMKAGTKNMLANVPRTLREILHIANLRVDYEQLASSGLSSVTVLGYARDKVFPRRRLKSTMDAAIEYPGVSYANPISLQDRPQSKFSAFLQRKFMLVSRKQRIRSGLDASHNDEQFNPSRVAGAVEQILRPTSF